MRTGRQPGRLGAVPRPPPVTAGLVVRGIDPGVAGTGIRELSGLLHRWLTAACDGTHVIANHPGTTAIRRRPAIFQGRVGLRRLDDLIAGPMNAYRLWVPPSFAWAGVSCCPTSRKPSAVGLYGELARSACALDQPPPPLMPTVLAGDLPPAGSKPSPARLARAQCQACRWRSRPVPLPARSFAGPAPGEGCRSRRTAPPSPGSGICVAGPVCCGLPSLVTVPRTWRISSS